MRKIPALNAKKIIRALMTELLYSAHLKFRLALGGIPYTLPAKICRLSKEHYFDKYTFKNVAVARVKFKGRLREMVVVYEKLGGSIKLITVHPLKTSQKANRIQSGRWQKL